MPGTIANRYQIDTLIGAGGMGEVYAGTDQSTRKPVAIKFLRNVASTRDTEALERFKREGDILRELDHPNIVKVLAIIDEPAQTCIIMEYAPGGSITDLIKSHGPLPVERTVNIALELADALARAHHQNIIHRDIKPTNVLLDEDGRPLLADFGLARKTELPALTATHAAIGTLSYMSPEAYNGQPPGICTDIWSFGVMLFEMLAGLRPFRGDTVAATLRAILTEPPSPDLETLRPDIPQPLTLLIYKMLEKDPARRLNSMRHIAAFLEDIKNGKTPDVLTSADSTPRTTRIEASTSKHNLTAAATTFIGREDEIRDLLSTVAKPDCRLLSLVGPGGIGKTRLALEVAAQILGDYQHGVFVVELAQIHAVEDIPEAIVRALGFRFTAERVNRTAFDQILDYLRAKKILLVLDNFEHLIEGVEFIVAILDSAPDVKIMVTTREVLNIEWEWVFMVQGMSVPDIPDTDELFDYGAIQLFVDRAQRTQSKFSLQNERNDVVRICRQVAGMPLGIELATSWLRFLTCEELASEMEKSLDILTSRQRIEKKRHRSLRTVFDYSWSLLTKIEQATLTQLSVFPASFQLAAARQVTGASLAVLSALVDKSLLNVDNEGWYALHPLVQQYLFEKLSNEINFEETVRDRHSHYYLNFVSARTERVHGADSPTACQEIEDEFENVKAALQWACHQGDSEHVEQALIPMGGFIYYQRTRRQVCDFWSTIYRSWQGKEDLVYVTLLAIFVNYSAFLDRTQVNTTLQPLFDECSRLLETFLDNPASAIAYYHLASASIGLDRPGGDKLILKALRRFKLLDYQWGISICHYYNIKVAMWAGDWEEAARHYEQHLVAANSTQCPYEIAAASRRYAWFLNRQGNFEEALQYAEQARRIYDSLDQNRWEARLASTFGAILIGLGRLEEACDIYKRSLPIAIEEGDPTWASNIHNSLGLLYVEMGDFDRAREHLETAIEIDIEFGDPYSTSDSVGELELAVGNFDAAQERFQFALEGVSRTNRIPLIVFMINQFARLSARQGDLKRSAELVGFAVNHPAADSELRGHAETLLAELQEKLPEDVLNTALECGKARQLEDVVADLLEEYAT